MGLVKTAMDWLGEPAGDRSPKERVVLMANLMKRCPEGVHEMDWKGKYDVLKYLYRNKAEDIEERVTRGIGKGLMLAGVVLFGSAFCMDLHQDARYDEQIEEGKPPVEDERKEGQKTDGYLGLFGLGALVCGAGVYRGRREEWDSFY